LRERTVSCENGGSPLGLLYVWGWSCSQRGRHALESVIKKVARLRCPGLPSPMSFVNVYRVIERAVVRILLRSERKAHSEKRVTLCSAQS
jgi:hypothetical protein